MQRKIIHIDMDAFYASIEQRDNPELRGKSLVVGGDPDGRGVVATCSYEARRYGIRSAMPAWKAKQLCPEAVFVRPRMQVYREASQQIHAIFRTFTDLIEPIALDEAYLDVTENKAGQRSATLLAQELKQRIHEETGLTASAGVSFNKFLAKVASDWDKPDGLTVITPKEAPAFIDQLPIRSFRGVGKVTEQKMLKLGIRTGLDLKQLSLEALLQRFGKMGAFYHKMAHCLDDRPVNPHRERKSVGREHTLVHDLLDLDEMRSLLKDTVDEVASYLKKRHLRGKTVTLKLRYNDFKTVTRSLTLDHPTDEASDILLVAKTLLTRTEAGTRPVRLLGVSLSNLLS